ncbi:putative plastid-lipid-associated protein 6 [Hibiscus syriacus]|uniref:Plastid-lipid-associated protein 6 n=1 Tax=Hibiscus syriacus TaxID=106335 RepID=A0A6A3BAG1_HIBSY|nr:putative plastid-lipid-associated protein 6 [Hibiscus syriacus]
MESLMQAPYAATVRLTLSSLERNLLPDAVIRRLTRFLLASRLGSGYRPSTELQLSDLLHFSHYEPKTQHYELPTSFFKLVLGKNFKYSSCCYFSDGSTSLDDTEEAMLELYCERSRLNDGHSVLDIGCGWGSLSLYISQKYPNCKVTGICNSGTQKAFIEEQCRDGELQNVEIIVADISTFEMGASYDRIYSIGMFEHMKNYEDLLKKISKWMKQDSLLFVDYFCHKAFAHHFEGIEMMTRRMIDGGSLVMGV